MCEFSLLLGTTIREITGLCSGSDNIKFVLEDGRVPMLFHHQECCEQVLVEDVDGDVDDLLNSPIVSAEVVTQRGSNRSVSETWSFYKISTIKGSVTIRWYGTSNGCYSEKANFTLSFPDDVEQWNGQYYTHVGSCVDKDGFHLMVDDGCNGATYTISSSDDIDIIMEGCTEIANYRTVTTNVNIVYHGNNFAYEIVFMDVDKWEPLYRVYIISKNANIVPTFHSYRW